jgi:hypothetical protein
MSQRAAAVARAPSKTGVARAVASIHIAPPSPEIGWTGDAERLTANSIGSFATLPAGAVVDADTQRRLATQLLIEQLAPALGLDLRRIRVEVHAANAGRLDAAGARGQQEGATIWLHPAHYRPQRGEGRYLLAHEATHAAQRQLHGPANLAAAEVEAAEIGREFAAGRQLHRPRFALAGTSAAADAGAKMDVPPAVDTTMVETSRARELAVIHSALGGLWVSDGDVFDVMRILDSVPYPIVKPMLFALSEQERFWLADNINPPHVYQHRRSVLACYYETLADGRLRDAVDLKVFRALQPSGMSTEEVETATWVLHHLSPGQRQELLESNNRLAISKLISAPRPTAEELERIRNEAANAARDEFEIFKQRRAITAMGNDSGAKGLLAEVRNLLSPPPTDYANPRPTPAQARTALDLLAGVQADRPRLLYVAEEMEKAGLIDQLLQLLPSNSYFDTAPHSSALLDLVQSRLPFKNEKLVEDLLSYGLFDWAIRDYEALFAYKLIRLLPVADQYRFRLRDGGKWYLRLLDNLPDDPDTGHALPGIEIRRAESRDEIAHMRELGATEVDEHQLLYNASQVYEKKRLEGGTADAIAALIAAFEAADKGGFDEAQAKDLFTRLAAVGAASLARGREAPADDILRATVVHELERLGWIDRLFGALPDSFLFAEANRVATVKLMLARDPARVQAHARRLVSRRFTDWMVTDGEAYLAYQCIKALPADEQNQFINEEPELWSRVTGEMSEAMRQSRDLNAYIGDHAGVDRASVLGRLAEAATWTEANAPLLVDLVRMAIAMTEHRFAFERSREFKAVAQPALVPLVEKYRLWDPNRRNTYNPDILQGTHWYEEGIFATLKSVWGAIVTVATADFLLVDRKVGVRADLGHLQEAMGGDIMGAKLADPAKNAPKDAPRHPDTNKVTLLVGLDGKSVELKLPDLELESANIQFGGSTMQSGTVSLKGLQIQAGYDSESLIQPVKAEAKIESLVANDLLLAKSASIVTATRLIVSALRLAAGAIDTVSPGAAGGSEKAIPVPLLVVPLLPLLLLMALPAYLFYKVATIASSLKNQGLENPDSHLADDAARSTKAISFTLGSLDVESLTTSGGQHVGRASVHDFSVRAGLDKATLLRAQSKSLAQRIAALQGVPAAAKALAVLTTQRTKVEADLAGAEADELEYLAIVKELRTGDASPERQKTMQARLDALKFDEKAGVFIDIGAVEVSGLSGTVTAKEPIRIDNIHGEGGGTALAQLLAMPAVTNTEIERRAASGERPEQPLAAGHDGRLVLELGDVKTGEFAISGGLRSVADIDRQLAELEPKREAEQVKPLYEALQLLRPKAARYELMVQRGVSQLDDAQLAEFRSLRVDLAAQADLIVQSIAIVNARLDADVATGRVGFSADTVRATGVDAPAKGLHVDEIVATGLGLSALPKEGLLGWADWKGNLKDAEGDIDNLEISGARSKYHGLLFEKATLTGAYAKVKDRGNLVEAGLQQLSVEGLGLVPRLGLLNRRLDGLREKARVAKPADRPALDEEIGKLSTKIAELQALADRRLAAFMRVERATTPDEVKTAKDEVAEVDGIIAYDLAQYGIAQLQLDEFGVRVSGAGDVLSDALGGGVDPMAVLERGGVTVTGAGPNDRLFKRLSLHQAQTVAHMPDKGVAADVGSFDIGETRADASARKEGDALRVDVPKFDVDALSLNQMLLTSSAGDAGYQAWSTGRSGIEKVVFQGSVRLDSRVPKSRDLSDYRLAQVHIDHFEIGRLYGNGLGFAMLGKKLELEIASGSISGIKGDGVDVAIPEDDNASPVVTGKLGIDSIDKLVVGKAIVGAWAVNSGRIDAKTISVELFEDGGIKAGVGDLDLADFSVRGPDGWVRFSLADLGGKLSYRNGALDIEDIHFGSLRVAGIHWKVGESGFVESSKPSTISDLKLKGRIETRPEPAKAAPGKAAQAGETERKISRISIERLHIGKVESEHLVYQDENNRIELRPADPAMEKHMVGFKPLFVQNLDVWGLNWTPEDSVSGGKVKVGGYEASAHYEGLKSGLRAGIALTGTGMSAEMVGKDAFTVDVGKIEKTGGELHNAKFDTGFATGSIVGKVAIGPDYIEAQDIEIGKAHFSGMRYRDLPKILTLDAINIDRIKLGRVRQNYTLSTDPATKGEKVPTTLEVRDLELFDILARDLDYRGESRGTIGEGADKKDTVSTQHIKGKVATISHLQVSKFDHDAILDTSSLSAKIDTGPGAKPGTRPFGIQGLSADLVDTIGSETTKKALLTDVQGGPLIANDIKFATVVLGTTTGPDGKPMDVTRTSIDGGFELSELGFINPNLTLTDAKGKTTTVGGYGSSVVVAGIKPRFLPNGAVALPVDAVIAKGLTIRRGDMTMRLPLLEIKDIAVGLRGMGTAKGLDMLATKIGQIHFEGASIEIVKTRKANLSDEEYAAALEEFKQEQEAEKKEPSGNLIAEPLSGLQGVASGEYNLDYWEDPDITPTIKDGIVDFGGMTNYAVQLHTENVTRDGVTRPEDKITLGNVVTVKTLKDFKRKMPGFYGDEGKYWYGRINLHEMVEGLANEPATAPERTFEPPEALRDFIGFTGEFSLGEGRIGRDKDADKKLGEGDTWIELKRDKPQQNTIKLLESNIGHQINLEVPEFHFSGAGFTAGKSQDGKVRLGKTGEITLRQMAVKVKGLADFTMTITLELKDGVINDVAIGDVTFTDAAELGKLVAPSVTDVDPKGMPK